MSDTIIDFIRHGEPQGGQKFRGQGCNDPLSDKGWQQMWRAVGERHPWNEIISSPLQRCLAFALALGEREDIRVTVDDRFKEVGFGSWEGRTPQQIMAENAQEYDAFYSDPVRNRPAGAEPLQAFSDRVSSAIQQCAAEHAGGHILVVAHAGVIRTTVGYVMQAPAHCWYRLKMDNAGITRLRIGRHGPILDFHNNPVL